MNQLDSVRWDLARALARKGCAICRISQKAVGHFLDAILYESANDPDIRREMSSALGFCSRHAWQMREMGGNALGTAFLQRTALDQWQRQLEGLPKPEGRLKFEKYLDWMNLSARAIIASWRKGLAPKGTRGFARLSIYRAPTTHCARFHQDYSGDKTFAKKMSLNQNQERVVAVTLRLLEERLAQIERLMTVDEQGILYHQVARYSPQQSQEMQALIEELRAGIKAIAETFHLPYEEQSPARKIAALTSITWEALEDLHAHRLGAYGTADPNLKDTIDPWARKLTRLILALEEAAQDR